MMSASWGTKTTSIHKVFHEIAERPEWNVDRQTDGQTAFQLYILYRLALAPALRAGLSQQISL